MRKDSLGQFRKGQSTTAAHFRPKLPPDSERGIVFLPLFKRLAVNTATTHEPIVTFKPDSYPAVHKWTPSTYATGSMPAVLLETTIF